MPVRNHNAQHNRVDDLPLVSERATVVEVEAMDRDRRREVRDQLLALARTHGFDDVIPRNGPIDWDEVFSKATATRRRLAPPIGAFRDRFERAHPSLVRIVLETDEPVGHAAGQYVSVRYGDRTRAYSIASSPNRPETELCVRRVPDGRLSPKLCEDLSAGDDVALRGPNGHLLLDDPSRRDLVFLATGTGVAPMKSMIDYTFEEGLDEYRGTKRNIWLFLGAGWVDDLPYHEAFEERATAHENFHYVPCCTREPWLTDWDGEGEYIQDAMLKYVDERTLEAASVGRHAAAFLEKSPAVETGARLDPERMEVYACGINAMVYGLETAVQRLGVPQGRLHCEGYG